MKKTIIGIAANQYYQANQEFFEHPFSYTPQGFVDGISQAGGLPLLLPISDPAFAAAYVERIDKLLLVGGQDVTPFLYGQEPHPKLGPTSFARDYFEVALIKEAIKQEKPIFTVCRGTQLLNIVLGGTLYQDLSLYDGWSVKHNMFPTPPQFGIHSITIKEKSFLAPILGTEAAVNSYHHQAIDRLAADLTPIAWAKDNIIEAVENKEKRLLGVQWHPELIHKKEVEEQALFRFFVEEL